MTTLKIDTAEQFEAWLEENLEPMSEDPDDELRGICQEAAVELYAALRPRWVPVSERLPETSPVLVLFKEPFFGDFTEEMAVGYYDDPADYEPPKLYGEWRFWTSDKPIKGGGVSHWMPLPPLPEES